MTRRLAALFIVVALSSPLALAGSYMRVVSWNLLHEGWAGQQDYTDDAKQIWNDFGSSSSASNGCDIVFLQEVMYANVPGGIASELSRISGKPWSYTYTWAIGRSTYKERYAVLYRTDRVKIESAWVWNDYADEFEREPFVVKIRDKNTGADYTFINWHTLWGDTTRRRQEIEAIADVFAYVQGNDANDQDVILLGDHNRPATSNWWYDLKNLSPRVTYKVNWRTSLNTSGNWSQAYDHFWFQPAYVTEYSSSGRDYIANRSWFRSELSDHAPIWLKLYSSRDDD